MPESHRPSLPTTASPTGSSPIVDSTFPPAVAGEDYERYRRSVWRHGERWFFRNTHRIARESIGMHEAHEVLWSVAARDLARGLSPHEERLLGELLQKEWATITRLPDDAAPEIPDFLISS
jgi:hypothetical protein